MNEKQNIILRSIVDLAIEKDTQIIYFKDIKNKINYSNISDEQLYNSLKGLQLENYLKIKRTSGGLENSTINLYVLGFMRYFDSIDNSADICKSISSAIYKDNILFNKQIIDQTRAKPIIVYYIIKYFESMGYIILDRPFKKGIESIKDITYDGERYFKQLLN
ncbi:hypothetical protein [Methanobacterium spitsbergense]|uniref:Uncharacterized protein n=1 Tax=Methanobacterium spitsbergense TaxID=2874285 RepID=A0A8T5V0S0_9EURY|nr:hypothetical protein [Methanobacterium spitsbergense]MBZ2167040.1 hypothetical protein [Methanobacterium spitsbergense]